MSKENNRSMPVPPAAKESHPSVAAPMEHGEETRTVPPVPVAGKPIGAAAQEGLFPEIPPPSPESFLAKAAHSVAEFIKPEAKEESKYLDPSKEPDHNLPVDAEVQVSEGGIEVRAIGLGFIDNQRKVVGDVFRIRDEKMLGEWMEPTDAKLAKKHLAAQEEKREKARKENEERVEHRRMLLGF